MKTVGRYPSWRQSMEVLDEMCRICYADIAVSTHTLHWLHPILVNRLFLQTDPEIDRLMHWMTRITAHHQSTVTLFRSTRTSRGHHSVECPKVGKLHVKFRFCMTFVAWKSHLLIHSGTQTWLCLTPTSSHSSTYLICAVSEWTKLNPTILGPSKGDFTLNVI